MAVAPESTPLALPLPEASSAALDSSLTAQTRSLSSPSRNASNNESRQASATNVGMPDGEAMNSDSKVPDDSQSEPDIASSRAPSPTPVEDPAAECSAPQSAVNCEQAIAECPSSMDTFSLTIEETADATSPHEPFHPLSESELYDAKVLVLDLLGWGVEPEYLLQRGVSQELLYTVFTDLKLRLPDALAGPGFITLANNTIST